MSFDQISELQPLFRRIDELQASLDMQKARFREAYDRIMDAWAVESTYNSNTIEGSTLSLGDTALVYEGLQVDGPADDIRQAEGGFLALRFLRQSLAEDLPLSEDLVKRAHELVFADAKDLEERGRYRRVQVEISGTDFIPTPAVYIEERMGQLVASCNRSTRHPVIIAALFHLEFESIHPFVNANGRTGRLLSNYILMKSGYEPVNIQAESRMRYIAALRAFQQQDDPYPFVAFFALNLEERLERLTTLMDDDTTGRADSGSRVTAYLDAPDLGDSFEDGGEAGFGGSSPAALSERICDLLRMDESLTQAQLAERLSVSPITIKRAMKRMEETGVLVRRGGRRYGRWVVRD